MLRFLTRRLLVAIPTLWVVITLAFFMMHAAPGGPFDGERKLPPAIMKNVEAKYRLDQPVIVQYGAYLRDALRGDLGPSMKYQGRTVTKIIKQNYGVSLTIGLAAILLASVLGVGFGVIAALKQNGLIDHVTLLFAVLGLCIPTFVTAPLLVMLFASRLGWLPQAGWNNGALPNLVLPVTVLALPQIAIITRLTRAGMIEVLQSNFIRTARAKGLSEWRIITRHALRPALLPLVSYLGPAAAGLITGSLVIEKIFNLPGLGKFFVISALQRDYTVVMGMVIFYAALILAFNLICDIVLALLDPRVKLS
ncbi:MAG: oligopeptide transporter permease OppB [Caulobacteraceae bacterium]|nr:oligopeptide transporter permease OppB [Caulobacteraceae bacterium]